MKTKAIIIGCKVMYMHVKHQLYNIWNAKLTETQIFGTD